MRICVTQFNKLVTYFSHSIQSLGYVTQFINKVQLTHLSVVGFQFSVLSVESRKAAAADTEVRGL